MNGRFKKFNKDFINYARKFFMFIHKNITKIRALFKFPGGESAGIKESQM